MLNWIKLSEASVLGKGAWGHLNEHRLIMDVIPIASHSVVAFSSTAPLPQIIFHIYHLNALNIVKRSEGQGV